MPVVEQGEDEHYPDQHLRASTAHDFEVDRIAGFEAVGQVALLDRFDTSLVVSVYVVLVLALTTVCVLLSPETSRLDLTADPVGQRASGGVA